MIRERVNRSTGGFSPCEDDKKMCLPALLSPDKTLDSRPPLHLNDLFPPPQWYVPLAVDGRSTRAMDLSRVNIHICIYTTPLTTQPSAPRYPCACQWDIIVEARLDCPDVWGSYSRPCALQRSRMPLPPYLTSSSAFVVHLDGYPLSKMQPQQDATLKHAGCEFLVSDCVG